MTKICRIGVAGCAGRMGQTLVRAIAALCLILGGIALTQVTWRRNTAAPQSPSTSRIE